MVRGWCICLQKRKRDKGDRGAKNQGARCDGRRVRGREGGEQREGVRIIVATRLQQHRKLRRHGGQKRLKGCGSSRPESAQKQEDKVNSAPRAPEEPSADERARHEVTHQPCQPWCAWCLMRHGEGSCKTAFAATSGKCENSGV